VSASHQDNGKLLSVYFRKNLYLDVQPPRSPDLNPLGFYLWRHLKTPAHLAPIKNEQIFHQRIFDACQTVDTCPETFGKARQSVIRRVLECARSDGGHFGHLL